MVEEGCEPGKVYWYFMRGEDFEPEFYATQAAAQDEWTGWAVEGSELEAWDDLEDDELEEWVEKLGLKAAP